MSQTNTHAHGHIQDEEMHEGHHPEATFFNTYVFSTDHKMIAKQFLITGMVMGVIGVMLSMFFRLQLAWPEQSFAILEAFLGDKAP